MTHYLIATDYDRPAHAKRDYLDIFTGPFADMYEGYAVSLPKGDGYMVTLVDFFGAVSRKVRVTCPVGRTDENYLRIDQAINDSLNEKEN